MGKVKTPYETRGVLSRLLRDQAGNTIAIMAAGVIPVIGFVGGGVDMSRMYLAQARLQAACDAGALMGRKTMGTSTWEANGKKANKEAENIFAFNYKEGDYGTFNVKKEFTESGGNVSGKASVEVPMSLMRVFGSAKKKINITCQAELRIPNTDVMFVLDTTGSMRDPAEGSTESKISGLRKAVKCFYETLAKKDIDDITAAQCGETSDPSAANSSTLSLRFGFVPYSENVNVGKLLPLNFMADQWKYQSRKANFIDSPDGREAEYGAESEPKFIKKETDFIKESDYSDTEIDITVDGVDYDERVGAKEKKQCDKLAVPGEQTLNKIGPLEFISQNPKKPVFPNNSVTKTYEQINENGKIQYRYVFRKTVGKCVLQNKSLNATITTNIYTTTSPITWIIEKIFNNWTYKQIDVNVGQFKDTARNSWIDSIVLPIDDNGTNKTITWKGCIEERQTYRLPGTSATDAFDPIPEDAIDLDIDRVPESGNSNTYWAPLLGDAFFHRENSDGKRTIDEITTKEDFSQETEDCPSTASLMKTWDTPSFKKYVNDLKTDGNTYHDIGLLWGARIISPTGIFAASNFSEDKIVERHIIFMTDGDTNAREYNLTAHGSAIYDRRQTPLNAIPAKALLDDLVDERTKAICKAIKSKNINLWVISYGKGVNSTTDQRLESCASPNKFFKATSVAALVTQFKGIAAEISNLRLTD
jgi:Flp pilus assembly protein TadG